MVRLRWRNWGVNAVAQCAGVTHWADGLYFGFKQHGFGYDLELFPQAKLGMFFETCNRLIHKKLRSFWFIACSFWFICIFADFFVLRRRILLCSGVILFKFVA